MENKRNKKGKQQQEQGLFLDRNNHKFIFKLENGVQFEVCDELGVQQVYRNLNTKHLSAEIYHQRNYSRCGKRITDTANHFQKQRGEVSKL